MEVEFADAEMSRLEEDPQFNGGFAVAVVRGYRKVMRLIRASLDERDFRAMRSVHFEKLKGERSDERSFRLNDQWRLIVRIKKSSPKNIIVIYGIEDYH